MTERTKEKVKSGTAYTITLLCILSLVAIGFVSGNAILHPYTERLDGGYVIRQYDDIGNLSLELSGDKVALAYQSKAVTGKLPACLTITVDGLEWQHTDANGSLIFAQNGVDIIADIQDKTIQDYRSGIKKKTVVILSTPAGTPICILQGDKVSQTVRSTPFSNCTNVIRLDIDGKAVYIHRAVADILPAAMLDS